MGHRREIERIAQLASKQDRVITRQAILAMGVTRHSITSLRERRFLNEVFPGTYLVGVPSLGQRSFLRACVCHSGPESWLTHRTGLENRGLLFERTGHAIVTTRRRNVKSPVSTLLPLTNGNYGCLAVHQSTPPLAVSTEFVNGFETTLLPRTLIDTAGDDGRRMLGWAWKEADYRGMLDPAGIRAELAGHRRAGAALVRERLLNAYPLTTPGTVLRSRRGELLFLAIVREAGLPTPEANVVMRVAGERYEADFLFREIGLVVEIDGPQHESEEAKANDKVRDLDFFVSGLDVIRMTTKRMESHRAWCTDRTRAAYDRQAHRAA